MNQGRVWCVVNPTVGLPLLLGSVAITSLIVHASVMTHVTWMSDYWSGSRRVRAVPAADNGTAPTHVAAVAGAPAFSFKITPVAAVPGVSDASVVVSVTPEPVATTSALADTPVGALASATPATE